MPLICDPVVLANDARCFDCDIPPGNQGSVMISLLSKLLLTFDPTADVTPNYLANEARCFDKCIPAGAQASVMIYLLCQLYESISGGGGGGGLTCLLGLWSVPTVVELRMVDVDTCPPVQAWTNGMDVEGDGQGSRYYWAGASLDADTGLSVICPNSRDPLTPGRWIQITGVA